MPDKTLIAAHEKSAPGAKSPKDRITLMYCVNATGQHKLKPLLIGKYQKPRCFKNTNIELFPVHYYAQKNAWMTTCIFECLFHQHFVRTVIQHFTNIGLPRRAILLLDNCAAHPNGDVLCSHDRQIKCVFPPPNTTSIIQPLDGGNLETTKRNYKKLLLQRLLTIKEGKNSPSLLDAIKSVNLTYVIYMVDEAWKDVRAESIAKVWDRTLLSRVNEQFQLTVQPSTASSECGISSESNNEYAATDSGELKEAGFDVNLTDAEEWLVGDRYEQGHSRMTDQEIVNDVCKPFLVDENEKDNDLVDEPVIPSQAFACFSKCII